MKRLAAALTLFLALATSADAQMGPGFIINTTPIEGLMDRLQASDDDLARYRLRAFYTISYYDPPVAVDLERSKLEAMIPDTGACRNATYSGPGVWDALIGFFQAHRIDSLILRRIKAADHTVEVVSRGWDGVSGIGAECSVGVYRIFFDIGKYMTLHYDFRPSFGPAAPVAWWEE